MFRVEHRSGVTRKRGPNPAHMTRSITERGSNPMLTDFDFEFDAVLAADRRCSTQRYSAVLDEFVTLNIEGADYVLRCGNAEHRLSSDYTSAYRLAAHWKGFCSAHKVSC